MDRRDEEPSSHNSGARAGDDSLDDENDVAKSSENVFPREKLMNGVNQAKALAAWGWTSIRQVSDDVAKSETVAKIRESTAPVIDKTVEGMSRVGASVAAATQNGVRVAGEKVEEAKPVVNRWAIGAREASVRAFEVAREQSVRGVQSVKEAVAARRGEEGAGSSTHSEEGDNDAASGSTGNDDDEEDSGKPMAV